LDIVLAVRLRNVNAHLLASDIQRQPAQIMINPPLARWFDLGIIPGLPQRLDGGDVSRPVAALPYHAREDDLAPKSRAPHRAGKRRSVRPQACVGFCDNCRAPFACVALL
jgi:hypothetical protein